MKYKGGSEAEDSISKQTRVIRKGFRAMKRRTIGFWDLE
jgi:hypothetical protein